MTTRPNNAPSQYDDRLLSPFFAAARARTTDDLPDALQARLLHDALALQPAPTSAGAEARPGQMARLGEGISAFGRQAVRLLGGAPGLAVISAAGLAGVWLGLAAPEPASGLLALVAPDSAVLVDDGSVWAQAARDLGDDEALLALLDSF